MRHMNMEERDFFSQIDEMLAGHHVSNQLTAHDFALRHQPMDAKLRELKEIFVCHYHGDPQGSADLLNSVLLDIINCGADIADHARVEETLLLPAVRKLEGEMTVPPQANEQEDQKDTLELTAREKEIVAAIAHGLSNKQIADRLCVSVHTVTTHRRNICAKLDIHSTAGLTIYALIHGIINIDDIRP